MKASYRVNGHTATLETGIFSILRRMQERNSTVVRAKFEHERTNGKIDKRAKPCVVVWRDYYDGYFDVYGNGCVASNVYMWIAAYNVKRHKETGKWFTLSPHYVDLSEFGNIEGVDY